MSARYNLLHFIGEDSAEARQLVDALQAEVLRKAAAKQREYGRARYTIVDGDGPSQRRKKKSKAGVVEALTRLIDPDAPALIPRHVTVLPHPHADGWLVRWQLGNESKAAFRRTRRSADALVDNLRSEAGKDTQPAESTQDAPAQAPHEDESLPPQLREALQVMSKRGPLVELNGQAEPEPAPATVEFSVDGTVTLTGWRLTELAHDYYGTSHMQLSGWLPEGWEPGSVAHGTNHMVRAGLPGSCAHAHNVNVEVEVKGYGGPQLFMKIWWPHAYDPARDARRSGESARASLGEFVPCAVQNGRCQRGEWSGKATERGWEQTERGWLCPQCAADAADRRDYLRAMEGSSQPADEHDSEGSESA